MIDKWVPLKLCSLVADIFKEAILIYIFAWWELFVYRGTIIRVLS